MAEFFMFLVVLLFLLSILGSMTANLVGRKIGCFWIFPYLGRHLGRFSGSMSRSSRQSARQLWRVRAVWYLQPAPWILAFVFEIAALILSMLAQVLGRR